MSDSNLVVEVVQGDVLEFAADVLAFAYAQSDHGSYKAISDVLVVSGADSHRLKPGPADYVLVDAPKGLSCKHVLLVGVPWALDFGYVEVEKWANRAIRIVGKHYPGAVHVATTLHGPRYGVDEIEALHAEIRGILSAAREEGGPGHSIRVSIVERDAARVERLQTVLSEIMAGLEKSHSESADQPLPAPNASQEFDVSLQQPITVRRPLKLKLLRPGQRSEERDEAEIVAESAILQSAAQVENKPRAFVAMPFSKGMRDVFYYGIQNPVRQLGYICERVDQEAFTGDILEQVKMCIENAEIVVADLTGANPNVYLEVGYAWGKGRQTVLVANKEDDLKFDVRGQRCLRYESIQDLEELLTTELMGLGSRKGR